MQNRLEGLHLQGVLHIQFLCISVLNWVAQFYYMCVASLCSIVGKQHYQICSLQLSLYRHETKSPCSQKPVAEHCSVSATANLRAVAFWALRNWSLGEGTLAQALTVCAVRFVCQQTETCTAYSPTHPTGRKFC